MTISNIKTSVKVLGAACLLAISSVAQAQITAFSDDFESYGVAGVPSVPDFTPPYIGFSDNGGFPGGYVFDPSTTGPQISALGYNGSDNHYWNTYANYDNVNVHDRGACSPCSPNTVEEIYMFREFTFDAAEAALGETWVFEFNYREADVPPGGTTEVGAYIRVFDPIFNILQEVTLDTQGVGSTWTAGKLVVTMDPLWEDGGIFQVGVFNKTELYNDSGMYYDDLTLSKALDAAINIAGSPLHPHHNDTGTSPFLDDLVPVVVFGQSTGVGDPVNLNTDDIDSASLSFGPSGGSAESVTYNLDTDSDGLDDARGQFRMSGTGIQCSDTEATLVGELTTGETFVGSDTFTTDCNALCHN